jgi:Effector-associated domain 11
MHYKREFSIYLDNLDKLRDLLEGNKSFISFGENEIYSKPFSIEPPKGYQEPNCFPEGCNYHNGIKEYIEDWFRRFPKCCRRHESYINKPWFRRENYIDVPDKLFRSILFTEFIIYDQIETIDWFKNITDYIEYCLHAFGSPEVGADRYYSIIKNYVEQQDGKIPDDKILRLLEFLEINYMGDNIDKKPTADMNILYATFQKWVKSIPSIGPFKLIKSQVADKFPMNLILYDGEYNPYLGVTKFRKRTNDELINLLIDLTRNTILSMTDSKWHAEFTSRTDDYQIVIMRENHLLKQKRLIQQYSKRERKYIKVIKQWLKNEKDFFKDLQGVYANADSQNNRRIEEPKIIKELQALIVENEFIKCFDKLLEVFVENSSEYRTTLLLKSRFNEYKRKNLEGTLQIEDSRIETNQIRSSLLQLVEKINIHTTMQQHH